MASLEEQKIKYQAVIEQIKTQGIQLANLHQQDGKLFIKGTAPSLEAANKVWDEIKRINPGLDDVSAYISVIPSALPQAATPQSSGGIENTPSESGTQTAGAHTYTVKAGDTLRTISKQFYGNPKEYMRIFNANQSQIQNENVLRIGQELTIPMD